MFVPSLNSSDDTIHPFSYLMVWPFIDPCGVVSPEILIKALSIWPMAPCTSVSAVICVYEESYKPIKDAPDAAVVLSSSPISPI